MSISSSQLEVLDRRLRQLAQRIKADNRAAETELSEKDPLISEANACEFLLPSPLTLESLGETVEKKIDNVSVLLERARMHESLPPQAQVAAEEDNAYIEDDYAEPPQAPGADKQ